MMHDGAYQLLLLTDNKQMQKKVGALCCAVSNIPCELHINTSSTKSSFDAVLIGEDKLALLSTPAIKKITDNTPVIYLREQSDNNDELTVDASIDETIDMTKITSAGFVRALTTSIEKYRINTALTQQKKRLEQLIEPGDIQKLRGKNDIKSNKHHATTENLIEENERLIEDIQKQNQLLKNLTHVDMVTRLSNKLQFDETLDKLLSQADRHNHMVALLLIDLDKFKNVNDKYGRQVGDALLQAVGKRLLDILRKEDFVARIGGDEFAVIINEIKGPHAANVLAWKITQALEKSFYIGKIEHQLKASIGIACYPLIGNDAFDLLKNADIAMRCAKKSPQIKYILANSTTQSEHFGKTDIESELGTAIENHELSIVYQPIYSIPARELRGFESLVRWNSKKLGTVSPTEFIPIAEDSGLIHPISQWIFESVCKQVSLWKKERSFPYIISINLSPVQLTETNFIQLVQDIVQKNNLSLNLIEFEVTEMAAIEENEIAISRITMLKELGASNALDDFGTGYSSIRHLRFLPISTIKIDQSFIQGLGKQQADDSIVSSIISLAKKMNLKVVAEGVETELQLNRLIEEGCDYVQGFLFSKPLSREQAEILMYADLNKKK
ncbi:MAG TPA: EAL domain-containing protein [Coxiellaceae bacterium]|nr:EAL domain-containing protein [Coxiellaceae bacterium]